MEKKFLLILVASLIALIAVADPPKETVRTASGPSVIANPPHSATSEQLRKQ